MEYQWFAFSDERMKQAFDLRKEVFVEEQGFALEDYCGKHIQRFVYQITNLPSGCSDVQAVLLVCDDTLVGGHVQAEDGSFVSTLDFPSATPSPTASAKV